MRLLPSLLLLTLLLAQVVEARPTVSIRDEKPLKSGNVSDTFLARSGGRVWFFKADGSIGDIQRYGNCSAASIPIALQLHIPGAATLPAEHPLVVWRPALLVAGFACVFFSLVVQGLTMKPLLSVLGIGGAEAPQGGEDEEAAH